MQSELEKVAWFQYFALLLIKKKTKFCKQQKIGGFEYFGDSDVVNKLKKILTVSPLHFICWFGYEKVGMLNICLDFYSFTSTDVFFIGVIIIYLNFEQLKKIYFKNIKTNIQY